MRLERWNGGLFLIVLIAVAIVAMMVRDSDGPKRAQVRSVLVNARPVLDPFLIELEERTFRFFWETANPDNGLIPIGIRRRRFRVSPPSDSGLPRIRSASSEAT